MYFAGYLAFAVAVTLLVCAVLTVSQLPWVRPTVIGVELVCVASGVIGLFNGLLTAVIGIVLAVGVISMLNREEVRDWYAP